MALKFDTCLYIEYQTTKKESDSVDISYLHQRLRPLYVWIRRVKVQWKAMMSLAIECPAETKDRVLLVCIIILYRTRVNIYIYRV
jgi:hypothetical protein